MIDFKVRLILERQGRILLLRQTSKNGGQYTLIGGRVENTELAKQALIRESEEETGIQLLPENLELAHVLHKKTLRAIRITLYFKAKVWSGDAVSKELNKFKSVEWFYLDNLPRNLSPTAKFVLEQYRSGKYYSELS